MKNLFQKIRSLEPLFKFMIVFIIIICVLSFITNVGYRAGVKVKEDGLFIPREFIKEEDCVAVATFHKRIKDGKIIETGYGYKTFVVGTGFSNSESVYSPKEYTLDGMDSIGAIGKCYFIFGSYELDYSKIFIPNK